MFPTTSLAAGVPAAPCPPAMLNGFRPGEKVRKRGLGLKALSSAFAMPVVVQIVMTEKAHWKEPEPLASRSARKIRLGALAGRTCMRPAKF